MTYPSEHSVEAADNVQVRRWYCFLPSPQTQHQLDVMNLIDETIRSWPVEERVRTSKLATWDEVAL